jgi:hypothetical protein
MKHGSWCVFAVFVMATCAYACRYTVRELGFVNLDGTPWTLVYLSTDPSFTLPVLANDVNVRSIVVDPTTDPNHPAALMSDQTVTAVLLGPTGRTLSLHSDDPIREATESPLRRRLAAEALDTFAFLLLKLGQDENENDHARRVAAGARGKLAALAPHLPRPVSHPLRVIELTAEDAANEHVLLWSLGIDQSDNAAIAIVYGRGRRAGEPLFGAFDETELTTQLALVGESCECETDRAWLNEPTAPMRWPEASAYAAPEALGFDPASPMVHAEVRRILARGDFGVGRPAKATGNRPKDLSEIVFGYTEVALEERLPETQPIHRPLPSTPPVAPNVELRRDDGWGFDEPTSTPLDEPRSSGRFLLVTAIGVGLVGLFTAAWILRR